MSKKENPDTLMHLNGIERLKQLESQKPQHGMAENLACTIASIEVGRVVYHYKLLPRHINHIGSLHGGIAASLVDSAMAAAALSTLPPNEWITMTDLSIKFIRAASTLDEMLTIEATVDHAGKRMFSTQGVITDSQGRILGRAIANAIRIKK
ncbi:PaaI family thioesterase [Thalassotalea profundi]|uniref:Thioesterase n=1 Tax=Thalassotalea profundi TaxID=2036687 RepID=A0ABQ3IV73_9GAMM|nr:PaaI family thioesterase [Thalassotalea profundi]GHE90802.1 thioesterase [Thalassotalea profundi]